MAEHARRQGSNPAGARRAGVRLVTAIMLVATGCDEGPGRLPPPDGSLDLSLCPGPFCPVDRDAGAPCSAEAPSLLLERAPSLARVFVGTSTDAALVALVAVRSADGVGHELASVAVAANGTTTTTSLSTLTTPAEASAAVVATATGFLAIHGDGGDVHARPLDVNGVPTGPDVPLRTSAADERVLDARADGVGFQLALDVAGVPTLASFDAALAPTVADVALPAGTQHRFVKLAADYVAYLDGTGSLQAVLLASLGAAPRAWSAGDRTVHFDVATAVAGSGFVYERDVSAVRHVVSIRALDASGTTNFLERSVAGDFAGAYEPSVAPIAGGFLVLYRRVPDDGSAPSLELSSRTTFGVEVASGSLRSGPILRARTLVRTANDGRVRMLFETEEPGDAGSVARLHAVRFVCP